MNIDTITDTIKMHNEDIHGYTKHSYWVLDGALPLNDVKHTGHVSDVVWMVNWWDDYLTHHIDRMDMSIARILVQGIDALNEAFGQYADVNELSKLDRASASIAIVRINGEKLEGYVLGDTEICIRTKKGQCHKLTDDKIEAFDSQVVDMIYNNRERSGKIVFNGYTAEEMEILRQNRMRMNSEEGYYILEYDRAAIMHGIYEEYDLSEIHDILLMSDGYSAIYNKYNEFSLKQLFDTCRQDGLKRVLHRIRTIEKEDLEFNTHKRLRRHDDATAVFICL